MRCRGYIKKEKRKDINFLTEEEIVERIKELQVQLEYEDKMGKAAWDTYGSELAGDIFDKSNEIKKEIDLLRIIFKNKLLSKTRVYADKFELDKFYEHNFGTQLHICGIIDTIYYGKSFIAETGWNKEKLKLAQYNWDNGGDKEDKKSVIRPGDGGWGDQFTPISMADGAADNYFEITREEFISNNTSK